MSSLESQTARLTTACWWGGLTVYSGIVVPIGASVLGATEQGFVTQRVTNWLNVLAAAALLASARPVFRSGRRGLQAGWIILALALGTLAGLHPVLDSLLVPGHREVLDHDRFYTLHRVYLWMTTVQWLAGAQMLWMLGGLAGATPHQTRGNGGNSGR